MTQLTFTETDGVYIATATVNSDFNVHIETYRSCSISIEISTVENKNFANKFGQIIENNVFDKDFHAAVYPKYVRIIVRDMPKTDACYITEAE